MIYAITEEGKYEIKMDWETAMTAINTNVTALPAVPLFIKNTVRAYLMVDKIECIYEEEPNDN